MRILSFDMSLSNSGWAVLDVKEGQAILVAYGSIGTKRYAQRSTGFRLNYIARELKALYKEYQPDKVVKERSFSNFRITATQQIFKVNGIWEMMAHLAGHDNFEEYTATTVKKELTGDGKANKEEVAKAVQELTGLEIKDNDVTDAIAVGYSYCYKEGLI